MIRGACAGRDTRALPVGAAPRRCLSTAPYRVSPLYVDRVFEINQRLNRDGIGVLLVEQIANMALSIAARGCVLRTGRIVLHDTAQKLLNNPMMRKAHLEL